MARLKRDMSVFSLVLINIENTEEVRDFTGHTAIQSIVRDFATGIRKRIRITDICSRYGMNKIMLVMPNTSISEAREICSKIASEIDPVDFIIEKPKFPVKFRVSAGFAQADATSDIAKLFESAAAESKEFYEISI